MMAIDIDRLGILLDRGEAAAAAVHQANKLLVDTQADARQAKSELSQLDAAVECYRGPAEGREILVSRAEAKRIQCDALLASIERKRSALVPIRERFNLWHAYCESLRACAKKHGVVL